MNTAHVSNEKVLEAAKIGIYPQNVSRQRAKTALGQGFVWCNSYILRGTTNMAIGILNFIQIGNWYVNVAVRLPIDIIYEYG